MIGKTIRIVDRESILNHLQEIENPINYNFEGKGIDL